MLLYRPVLTALNNLSMLMLLGFRLVTSCIWSRKKKKRQNCVFPVGLSARMRSRASSSLILLPIPATNCRLPLFSSHSRKEMFQPHLPVRLPCYDLAPITSFTLDRLFTPGFRYPRLSWLDGRCVQGPGTYSPRHG